MSCAHKAEPTIDTRWLALIRPKCNMAITATRFLVLPIKDRAMSIAQQFKKIRGSNLGACYPNFGILLERIFHRVN